MFKGFHNIDGNKSKTFNGFPTIIISGRSGIVKPVCWLDADDVTNSVTKDGSDLVSSWHDKNGSGIAFTESTNKPLWQSAQINGKAAISFDLTNDKLTNAIPFNFGDIMIVANHNNTTFSYYNGLLTGNSPTDLLCSVDGPETTTFVDNVQYSFYKKKFINNVLTSDFAPLQTSKIIHLRKGSGILTFSGSLYLGVDRTFSGRSWDGQIAEVIFFPKALIQDEWNYWLNYLSDKYAITLG